ncbi:MAG: methyltransferase domain-containing protein [Phycisphaerae bacterium]|nr:methyltransferase domain-containing protein [Phycisphaerae bacterium]
MTAPRLLNLGCGRRRHPAWTNADLRPDTPEVLKVDLRQPLPFLDGDFDGVYASHVLEHLTPAAGRALVYEMQRVLRPGGICRLVVPDLEGICRAYLAQLDRAAAGDAAARDRHAWMTLELVDQMTRTRSGGLMLRDWQREPIPAEDFVLERFGAEARDAIARIRAKPGRTPLTEADWDELPEPTAAERAAFYETGESHRWMYDRVSLGALLTQAGFADVAVMSASTSRIPGWGDYGLDADAAGRPHKPDSLFVEGRKT